MGIYIRMSNNNINQTESGYHQYDVSNGCCAFCCSSLPSLPKTPNTPIESKSCLSVCVYAVLLGGLFLLAPPCTYFQAFSVGEASFLEQIAYHSGPPPVPLVSAFAARFHEHGLHAFDHLNDGQ